jgi:hypothetical protein
MTKTLHLRSFEIPALNKFGIGFDNVFDDLMRVTQTQSSTLKGQSLKHKNHVVKFEKLNHNLKSNPHWSLTQFFLEYYLSL